MRKLSRLEKYHMNKVSMRSPSKVIAAHLWLQCMDVASGDVERARIAVRRDQCITKGNGLRRGDYSGIGCCGVVYD